jgi:ankyrin repeat protein
MSWLKSLPNILTIFRSEPPPPPPPPPRKKRQRNEDDDDDEQQRRQRALRVKPEQGRKQLSKNEIKSLLTQVQTCQDINALGRRSDVEFKPTDSYVFKALYSNPAVDELIACVLKHPGFRNINPSSSANYLWKKATGQGWPNVVAILLRDERIDPAFMNNGAILYASKRGHADVVKVLLRDKRVDPSTDNNKPIKEASYEGRIAVVKLLLKDKRVDPSAGSNTASRAASGRGHAAVVELLMQDKRVDPSDENNSAIRLASNEGKVNVIKLLLRDKRVDPSDDNNNAIRVASYHKHIDAVKVLLQDKRVDPTADNNYAIQTAMKTPGSEELFELLFRDERMSNKSKFLNDVLSEILSRVEESVDLEDFDFVEKIIQKIFEDSKALDTITTRAQKDVIMRRKLIALLNELYRQCKLLPKEKHLISLCQHINVNVLLQKLNIIEETYKKTIIISPPSPPCHNDKSVVEWEEFVDMHPDDFIMIYFPGSMKKPYCYNREEMNMFFRDKNNEMHAWVRKQGQTMDSEGFGGEPNPSVGRYVRFQFPPISESMLTWEARTRLLETKDRVFQAKIIGKNVRVGNPRGGLMHGQTPGESVYTLEPIVLIQ